MENQTILERLENKRIALAMSAGFFGFYHQAGVLKALTDAGIYPARISGNSAGALTAAMYAAGLSPSEIRDVLTSIGRKDFWDLEWPLDRRGAGILGGNKFQKELERVLPVKNFESCRIPLTVGAYDIDVGRMKYFSSGELIPAVYASCAIPYLFKPIYIKERRFWDGGFAEKTPLAPFIKADDIDTVVISLLPPRERELKKREGLLSFIPSFASLFADIPNEERKERDSIAVSLLRESGKEVITLSPARLPLGPFSLEKAQESFTQGEQGAIELLKSVESANADVWGLG